MKINKKLIKELVDNLTEFNLTELEYQEGDQKIKVSKASRANVEQTKAFVSGKKEVLSESNEEGIRIKSPIIGTSYLAPEPGGKKFIEVELFESTSPKKRSFVFSKNFSSKTTTEDPTVEID